MRELSFQFRANDSFDISELYKHKEERRVPGVPVQVSLFFIQFSKMGQGRLRYEVDHFASLSKLYTKNPLVAPITLLPSKNVQRRSRRFRIS